MKFVEERLSTAMTNLGVSPIALKHLEAISNVPDVNLKTLCDVNLKRLLEVKEKYQGLAAKQLLDFKALRGDPSDNIPGVEGIGEKTAITLIKKFGSIENLYRALEVRGENAFIRDSVKKKLLNGRQQAFMSKELAEIKRDVQVELHLEKCRFGQYDKSAMVRILEDYGFRSLISRLPVGYNMSA